MELVGKPPNLEDIVTDHGDLGGLLDDDHPQYLNEARGDARYYTLATELATDAELEAHIVDAYDAHDASAISVVPAGTLSSGNVQLALEELASDIVAGGIPVGIVDAKGDLISATGDNAVARVAVGTDGQVLVADSSTATGLGWDTFEAGDHGGLTGLDDDDHPQYHNDARGDARYWQLTTDLATQAELDAVTVGPEVVVAASNAAAESIDRADYVCDGTDDDVQIQAAIDALPASGGKVLLTEGTFYIGATITLPTNKRMTLEGCGPVTTELSLQNGANVDMILAQGQQQVVCNLSLNGNKANQSSTAYGIKVTQTKVWLDRLWIAEIETTGIYVVGTALQTAHANKITNCYLSGCGQDGLEFGTYSYDAQVVNTWIGTSGRDGIRINTSNIMLQLVHSWGNTGSGVYVNSGSGGYAQIIGGYFETNLDRGIRIGSTSPGCVIQGCLIRRNKTQGIYNFSGHKMVVTGCTFSENGYGSAGASGIRVDTVNGAVVVGNTFYDDQGTKTQTYAIDQVGSSDYILFIGNDARAANHLTGATNLTGANDVVSLNVGNGGAASIPITDSGGNFAATNVETALAELFTGKTSAAAALAAAQTEIADQKRVVEVLVSDPNGDPLTTGDGKAHFFIPPILNGHNLVDADACVTTVSTSGLPTIQVHNLTQAADMLSTRITIDENEKTSYTADAPPVIDGGNDDVATGDELRIDIDVAGTGTKGLAVILTFEAP